MEGVRELRIQAENLLENKNGKIDSLQGVRALAFFGIFTSHCGASSLGAWGVSVFLILSGFLMVYAYYHKELPASAKDCAVFTLRKIKKLYPLHILMMLAALALAARDLLADFSVKQLFLRAVETVLNLALVQTWIPSGSFYFSLNAVSWYLSVCLFVYAAFPVILKQIQKFSGIRTAIVSMILIWLLQLLVGYASQYVSIPKEFCDNFPKWVTYIWPLFRLGDFCIGCCLGYIFIHVGKNINAYAATALEMIALALVALSCVMYYDPSKFSGLARIFGTNFCRFNMLFAVSSSALVFVFALNKGFVSKVLSCKPFVYIGNISAYAFLIHQMVIRYFRLAYRCVFGGSVRPWTMVIITFVITVCCTEIYRIIEKQSFRLRKEKRQWEKC